MKKPFSLILSSLFYITSAFAQPASLTPQTVFNTSFFLGKTTPSKLYSIVASVGSTAIYVMVFDTNSGSIPSDGTVSPNICLGPFSANNPFSISWNGPAATMNNGLIVVMSSTGCTTKTATNVTSLTVNAQ